MEHVLGEGIPSLGQADAVGQVATSIVVEGASSSVPPPSAVSHGQGPCVQPKAPPRRSMRHPVAADGSSVTDEDALSKAMRRKAALLSPPPMGTSKNPNSFLSYSSSKISSSLAQVGVKLGRNENEIIVSANALKHVEYDRLKVYPCASSRSVTTPLDDEDANATIDGQLLSHLVGEVTEVDMDETELGSIYDLHASGRKSKYTKDRKNKKVRKFVKQPKYKSDSQ